MHYSEGVLGNKEFGVNYSHISNPMLHPTSTLLSKHQV
jgi:hypothetical protein